MELKNKFAIGCLVQWYEIEMVGEYLQSVKNAVDKIPNKQNIIILTAIKHLKRLTRNKHLFQIYTRSGTIC